MIPVLLVGFALSVALDLVGVSLPERMGIALGLGIVCGAVR